MEFIRPFAVVVDGLDMNHHANLRVLMQNKFVKK